MRAGICSIQQGLTPEAASTVKQAIGLARRRGHAQVTPLHVASAMLASSGGLFRRACIQAHSHPLQCKALELCFNVALNRLPASTSTAALLGGPPHHNHHHHSSVYPSLSNALVAAFKRAQAHQRRGSVDSQQQPILAVKIEAEQLVISILDDPSVSRVMREAGFSSPHIKSRVEQAVNTSSNNHNNSNTNTTATSSPLDAVRSSSSPGGNKPQLMMSLPNFGHHQFLIPKLPPMDHYNVRNEDVTVVLNTMASKKRNIVVTGECIDTSEAVVRAVMDNIERGLVPTELRSAQFTSLPLFSLCSLSKEEIDRKLMELRCNFLRSSSSPSSSSKGVVLYLGDLKWVAEFWSNYGEQTRYMSSSLYYSSMEYIIMEIKRLVRDNCEGKLWVVGIASFQTYMKCKAGHPSLESMWELFPFTVPVGSLSLSLNHDSELEVSRSKTSARGTNNWPTLESAGGIPRGHFSTTTTVAAHVKFNGESRSNYGGGNVHKREPTRPTSISASTLPSWLQQCKEETEAAERESVSADEEKVFTFFDIFEPKKRFPHQKSWNNICESRNQSPDDRSTATTFRLIDTKPDLLSNPNSSPNSASSSEASDDREDDGLECFKEFNGENLNILCNALEQKVPHQKEIIPEIATAVLECRSGMKRRKLNNVIRSSNISEKREETWLLFSGDDSQGKENTARELARVVYGSSHTSFVPIKNLSFSSRTEGVSNSNDDNESGGAYLEQFAQALNENPHRVFLIEDFQRTGCRYTKKGIEKAIRTGMARLPCGESVPLMDAIVILSCKSFNHSEIPSPSSPSKKRKRGDENNDGGDHHGVILSLDLNIAIGGNDEDMIGESDEYEDEEESIGDDPHGNRIEELVDRSVDFKFHGEEL
ncbi:Protein SMAX1-LIKE 3 [Linum perenne]